MKLWAHFVQKHENEFFYSQLFELILRFHIIITPFSIVIKFLMATFQRTCKTFEDKFSCNKFPHYSFLSSCQESENTHRAFPEKSLGRIDRKTNRQTVGEYQQDPHFMNPRKVRPEMHSKANLHL